jgi:rhodanese-related sulfurtransferase
MQRENLLQTVVLGQKRIYSLTHPELKDFWEQIQQFALKHNPANVLSSDEIYEKSLEWTKDLAETTKLIKARKVTLLDVRPQDEVDESELIYKKYVLHIPADELKKSKEKLPKSRPVLVICRGRLCVMSNEATYQLKKIGFDAHKLNMSWHQLSQNLMEV